MMLKLIGALLISALALAPAAHADTDSDFTAMLDAANIPYRNHQSAITQAKMVCAALNKGIGYNETADMISNLNTGFTEF
jgi:hypothetical protein